MALSAQPGPLPPTDVAWDDRDVLLYALAVGAADLPHVLETRPEAPLQVLPTFAAALLYPAAEAALADADWTRVLFGETSLVLHRPLPVRGTAQVRARIVAVHDQGSGALVVSEATAEDAGGALATATQAMFVRGAGGFGGARAPTAAWTAPEGDAPLVLEVPTRADQALLYRLTGDRNPLHADPAFAAAAGFDHPILHGLCTLGSAVRALLPSLPGPVTTARCRFTAPVTPGETLTVRAWPRAETTAFTVSRPDGTIAVDRAVLGVGGSPDTT